MLNEQEIKHISSLARLGIEAKESIKLQKDLAAILEFVEKLTEVDVEGVRPTAQATGLAGIMRQDDPVRRDEKTRERLLSNAPEKKSGYIKVKEVFE